jgi:hypothetical protein
MTPKTCSTRARMRDLLRLRSFCRGVSFLPAYARSLTKALGLGCQLVNQVLLPTVAGVGVNAPLLPVQQIGQRVLVGTRSRAWVERLVKVLSTWPA